MSEDEESTVIRTVIDLSRLGPAQQFEYFADEITRKFGKLAPDRVVEREDFPALIDTLEHGSSRCVRIKTPIHTVNRTSKLITQDDSEDFYLNFMLSGVLEAEHAGERMTIAPGDMVIFDHRKPFAFETKGADGFHSGTVVRFARRDYSDGPTQRALLDRQRFAKHKLAPLLKTSLSHLSVSMTGTNDIEVASLLHVVEILVGLIARDNSAEIFESGHGHAIHIIEFEMRRQARDPGVCPQSIALSIGSSPQAVEKILADHGMSFWKSLENIRLSHALSELRNAANKHKTVAQIAQESGFVDLPSFYRLFNETSLCKASDICRALMERPSKLT